MRFRKGNTYKYGQDHSQHRGIPSGVNFSVEFFGGRGMFKLVGPGHGELTTTDARCPRCGQMVKAGGPSTYGCGALYVWGLTKSQYATFAWATRQALALTPDELRDAAMLIESRQPLDGPGADVPIGGKE